MNVHCNQNYVFCITTSRELYGNVSYNVQRTDID